MSTRKSQEPHCMEGCILTSCLCFSSVLWVLVILVAVMWLIWDSSMVPYIPMMVGASTMALVIAVVLVIYQRRRVQQ
ncbi:MAG: hypothetical protein ACFFCO_10655 [Promethearchaeota archaeon]